MQYCCIVYFCSMKPHKITARLDGIGITASTLCAIHCALVPFLITLLPLWGLEFLAEEWIEISMIVLALIIGAVSLGVSFRKHHRNYWPLSLLGVGFLLIISGHLAAPLSLEPVLTPAGGIVIAAAHFVNWRVTSCRLYVH